MEPMSTEPMSTALVAYRPPRHSCIRKCVFATRYLEQAYQHDDDLGNPGARIWIVQAGERIRKETGKGWCVWIDPAYLEESKVYAGCLVDWITEFDAKRGKYGFCLGRPMMEFIVRVPLCIGVRRPRKLYRAIHSEHLKNGDGLCARGFGKIQVNPLTFQIHLQKHLNWACRDLSPFMSATPNYSKARNVCASYEARGHTDIQILIIDTTGPEWDQTGLFQSREVVQTFRLPILNARKYIDEEYLIQDEIPQGKVTRVALANVTAQYSTRQWKADVAYARSCANLDTKGRKRKRSGTKVPGDTEDGDDSDSEAEAAVEADEAVKEDGFKSEEKARPPKKYRTRTKAFSKVSH